MSKRNVLQRLLGGVKSFGRALADNSGQGADWFGPQQPMPAQAPAEVAGRQFDYPVGYNLWQQPKVFEGRDFRSLRGLADGYDVLRLLIETRKDQMCGLPWVIKRRDPTAVGDDPRIAALESFFRCPDGINSWSRWLRMLLEDLLVIDAPTLYIQRTLGGQALAFQVMDGATIKPVIDDFGRRPAPPAPAYQQVLKGLPAVDYTADDLLYLPRNPRSHRVYGYSPVEQLEMTVNIALRRQLYQLQYYTEGNIPEALIGVPDTWNPDQIKQFQAYWDILHEGDTASRRHAKFVPGGVAKTFIPIKEPELKGVFDEWLARVACYCFSVSPQPFVAQMNRATAETAAQTAESEGNQPAKLWVKELIDGILTREFAAPDLEFIWQIPASLDPSVQATTINTYVRAGVMTLNESRNLLGLAPVADGDQPLIYTGTGVVTLHNALASGNSSAPGGHIEADDNRNVFRVMDFDGVNSGLGKNDSSVVSEARIPPGNGRISGEWTTSDKAIAYIDSKEKFRASVYEDEAGIRTIGYGHRVKPGEIFPSVITIGQAHEIKKKDISYFENAVRSCVKVKLNQNQFDALVILSYNIGAGALKNSEIVKSINNGDYDGAAKFFSVYTHYTDQKTKQKKVSNGLVARRLEEARIFLSGEYPK